MNSRTHSLVLFFVGLSAASAFAQSQPDFLPEFKWHLTARPWTPIDAPKSDLLDRVDSIIHALAPLQYYNEADASDPKNGAIIDAYEGREWQYATPYFAFASAMALSEGRAADLIQTSVRAMDRCTRNMSEGKANDGHGEFFFAPMVKALRLLTSIKDKYPTYITDEKIATWRARMSVKRMVPMVLTVKQNWRTYQCKGEWLRQKEGLISDAVEWIERNWKDTTPDMGDNLYKNQRSRFRVDVDVYPQKPSFLLYHDNTGVPETFAYNGAVLGNYLDMLENGYDGPSAAEMRATVEHNARSSLLLMAASGDAPAGGRSGAHVWNDVVYANVYEMMAEIEKRNGDLQRAGQFRRAAQLAWKSMARFQQERGWFSVTKSFVHPSHRNGYAHYSALTNYNGYCEIHNAEAYLARKSDIAEQPAPSEIGGYCVQLDPLYENTFLNAGGMQVQICTLGNEGSAPSLPNWDTLGISRFSRVGWDSRLGPADGFSRVPSKEGVNFAPIFEENGVWTNVAQLPTRYRGNFTAEFVHPLLIRGTLTLAPKQGQTGPAFTMKVTLTPDGALIDTARTSGSEPFAVCWPLLEFDGRTVLVKNVASQIASTSYPKAAGQRVVLPAPEAEAKEWREVDGGDGGATTIGFRYALEGDKQATATAKLWVNDKAQPALTFLSTRTADDWHELRIPVTLAAGKTNVIRLEPNAVDKPKIGELRVFPATATTPEPDQENFIALRDSHELDATAAPHRGSYGDLRPIRVTDAKRSVLETFVYPRSAGDPSAAEVRASFKREGLDFSSVLGCVKGKLYVGRTSAGGEGSAIDLDGDGKDDVTFDKSCAFMLQLKDGRVTAVETDQPVKATLGHKQIDVTAFRPVNLTGE